MFIEAFSDNPFGTNCWLLSAEGSDEAVVVDSGFEPSRVHGLLEASGKTPTGVLLTHAHLDHAGEAGTFAGDLPVFIHRADAVAFTDIASWNAGFDNPLDRVEDLRIVEDGQNLALAGLALTVIHTPGHTPGHCMFRADGAGSLVLSGDLVFAGAIGRSDFPNSSPTDITASLRRFLELPDELPVFPGHGPTTTVGRERATNPFLMEMA